MGRLSLVVMAVALLLAGCGGGEDETPIDETSAVDPGPDLAFAELEMVPEVSTYAREVYDDSGIHTIFATYSSPLEGGPVVVEANDYVLDPYAETVPGALPSYWTDADDPESFPNGWTCANMRTGPSCYRPLTDGLLQVDCELSDCALDIPELAELSGMLHEAFSGGSTFGGASEAPEPCEGIDADDIAEALDPWLGDGEVTLLLDDSEYGEFYTCLVELPARSLDTSDPDLQIVRHEYVADTRTGSAECSFGGTDPDSVHDSALACLKEADASAPAPQGVESTAAEDGPGGTVVSGMEVVQAEEGDYWWEVSLTEDTFQAPQFDALTDLARTLPTD